MTPDEATDILAIQQLICRERESRDLCLWRRMASCFHADSRINISWFSGNGAEFVAGSKDMYERGMRAKHRLGPILVSLNGARAVATLSGIIDIPQDVDGIEVTLSSHCLMIYTAEKRAGEWGLMSFSAIYRRDELVPATPGQYPEIDPAELAGYRASYRHLSWSLARTGYAVNNDLPGEDRPETAAAVMAEVYGWAGLPIPD